jgi:lipoprotein-anchoring transpeptidase ErfK/SrfK
MLLLTACGGNPQVQQQANASKVQLDAQLQHAQTIGVPQSILQPVLAQEQQLSSSSAPFTLFNDQPANDYYANLATRYHQLLVQLQGIISVTTQQFQLQAQRDLQNFQMVLKQSQAKNVGNLQPFSQQLNADETRLTGAQYPKDYAAVSADANQAVSALNLLGLTYNQLSTFNKTIAQMKAVNLDTAVLQSQYQSDMNAFNKAVSVSAFQNLNSLINAQNEQAVVTSYQAFPYVSAAKLSNFKSEIDQLESYGINASAYSKLYNADLAQSSKVKTVAGYLAFFQKVDADVASMQNNLVQGEASALINKLNAEATAWGNAHLYHDSYDGNNYILDSGYTQAGIGYWLNQDLNAAASPSDYQSVVDEENNEFFNLQMMEADYKDPTPYNQVHATDMQMLNHYNLQKGQVLVVSLVEQAMRVYQDGHLVRAFHVTTGRVELPSLPGVWSVVNRQSPTTFVSSDPPGSPYYYPPTPINYAIEYHVDGYFVHDAWWRNQFGPGTQFPHNDQTSPGFSTNGSHGCINMQEDDAAWVYAHTDWNTTIVVY